MDKKTMFLLIGAFVLLSILIGLVIYFTTRKQKAEDEDKAPDCINLFLDKLKSFAKTTNDAGAFSTTGEVVDYNHFCKSIDAGIAVDCPGLTVSMAIFGLKHHYYEGLRPETVNYKEGQVIDFINDNGTIKPPEEYKLIHCRGIPRDAVFRFVLKHDDLEDDVAFHISIPDFMGKVMKA